MAVSSTKTFPKWLETAIFYQIYPQSFFDHSGDGIGDLPGIIERLDYLQWLGVNALWINPCFASPFQDAGYDISDFRKVAPRYGTNEDLVRLFEEAHRRGMRVCLDLVAGHTSIQHPWFEESARAARNALSERYIWTRNIWDEAAPPLRAIQNGFERDGAYIANFFAFQPALNYGFASPDPACPWQLPPDHPECRAVRDELIDIMRFWLRQGCDGFRVDMAFSLIKNDLDFTETVRLWRGVRERFEEEFPEAILMAEWGSPKHAIDAGFHVDFLIHSGISAYNCLSRHEAFRDVIGVREYNGNSYLSGEPTGELLDFLDPYLEHYEATKASGFISVPTGCHDISRLSLGRSTEDLKVALALHLLLPGTPCIYYGDEIGLRAPVDLPSKEGGYRRTSSRTPMQWDAGGNAGFSRAEPDALYLPVDPSPDRPTVEGQRGSDGSVLEHTRRLLALRREYPCLQAGGAFEVIHAERGHPVFVFWRQSGAERIVVVINPSRCAFALELKELGSLSPLYCEEGLTAELSSRGPLLRIPPISFGLFIDCG